MIVEFRIGDLVRHRASGERGIITGVVEDGIMAEAPYCSLVRGFVGIVIYVPLYHLERVDVDSAPVEDEGAGEESVAGIVRGIRSKIYQDKSRIRHLLGGVDYEPSMGVVDNLDVILGRLAERIEDLGESLAGYNPS